MTRKQTSEAFGLPVGQAVPSDAVSREDRLIDPGRYPSEGDWAFCRFDSERVPAVRLGFQRGGFNVWPDHRPVDPGLVQLHLEVMTADGAWIWLPAGRFTTADVATDPSRTSVRIGTPGAPVMTIDGWPRMTWWARSEDGELEVDLAVDVRSVTALPDCRLPHTLFAMWETVGRTSGTVRVGADTVAVQGAMFYDHTRVLERSHPVVPRRRYVYTTLTLDDGSALFGYDATGTDGRPIEGYCFGVHVEADGRSRYLDRAQPIELDLDADGLPARYRVAWSGEGRSVVAEVSVRPSPLVRSWGAPGAPRSRAEYPIIPLVLDATVRLTDAQGVRELSATGLAEHFDAATWETQVPG